VISRHSVSLLREFGILVFPLIHVVLAFFSVTPAISAGVQFLPFVGFVGARFIASVILAPGPG
jgi:hypothetical protein